MKTIHVESRPMERILATPGSLAAREQANLSVKVPGRVKVINVDIGSEVKKGDVIAQLDPRDYELRLQLAQASYAQARAAVGLPLEGTNDTIKVEETTVVQQARAVLDEATKNRDRVTALQKQGISSGAELDTAEAAFRVAQQRYEASHEEARVRQATLAQKQAELDLAKQQLSDTSVRAPWDGVVQQRLASPGEFLAGGAQVITIVQVDPLRLRLEIAERSAANIRVGQSVRLVAEGDTRRNTGKISRVSPAITEENRMLIVEADVPNPGTLRPGQFVRAEIILTEEEQGLSIPPDSLVVFAGLEKVVVVEDGKAVEKNVRSGRRGDNWVEIVSGLKGAETVVLNPGGIRTGQPVTVENGKAASATATESVR